MDEPIDASTSAAAPSSVVAIPTRGKIPWWGGTSIHQHFSLPSSIIYYLAKKPSNSKVYSKLAQSCKYFFEINPVLVAADMFDYMDGDVRICPDKECQGFGDCCVEYDINNTVAQIWLTNLLRIKITNYASLLCSKFYRSGVIKLKLFNQTLFYDNFKLLIPYVREAELVNVEMRHADESCVMLETIIEDMPNIVQFKYKFKSGHSVVDTTTMQKIAALGNLGSLKTFNLYNIPDSFKVQDLSDFIMSHNNIKFLLSFVDSLSDGYKAELDALIDTVIESQVSDCVVFYDGQDGEKLFNMIRN